MYEEFENCIPYQLGHLKMLISGQGGNGFDIIGKAVKIVQQVEGKAVSKRFSSWLMDSSDYDTLLRRVKQKTGITLVSTEELNGVNPDLYEIEENENQWL